MILHCMLPIYFSYFQESFLWFKAKTGIANLDSTNNEQIVNI